MGNGEVDGLCASGHRGHWGQNVCCFGRWDWSMVMEGRLQGLLIVEWCSWGVWSLVEVLKCLFLMGVGFGRLLELYWLGWEWEMIPEDGCCRDMGHWTEKKMVGRSPGRPGGRGFRRGRLRHGR